jgi:hypothetical protein
MKNLFAQVFLVLLFISSSAFSQNVINEAFLDQLGTSNSDLVDQLGIDLLNKIIISQTESNDGGILKFQNGEFISGNLAEIVQFGNRNTVSISQNGDNNSSSVKQLGDDNFYDLELTGNENRLGIIQFGNENSILQRLSSDGLNCVVNQAGSNNEFIQVESGMDGRKMIITQSGGMKLIIR